MNRLFESTLLPLMPAPFTRQALGGVWAPHSDGGNRNFVAVRIVHMVASGSLPDVSLAARPVLYLKTAATGHWLFDSSLH